LSRSDQQERNERRTRRRLRCGGNSEKMRRWIRWSWPDASRMLHTVVLTYFRILKGDNLKGDALRSFYQPLWRVSPNWRTLSISTWSRTC
jgi:hypothetical protein